MPTGFTQVSASALKDSSGVVVANATISFYPVDNLGMPISFRAGGGGQVISMPVYAQVTNGAFTLLLADSVLTMPVNVGYYVTVIDNITGKSLLGAGYSCVQPTGATWNFDTYQPNLAPLALTQYGPQGDSAYEVAKDNGFVGTEAQWVASLKGEPGDVSALGLGQAVIQRLNYRSNFFDYRRAVKDTAINATTGVAFSTTAFGNTFYASDYCLVAGQAQVRCNTMLQYPGSSIGFAFYNINKVYISGNSATVAKNTPITVPNGAAYMRFSWVTGYADFSPTPLTQLMLVPGDVDTSTLTYIGFGYYSREEIEVRDQTMGVQIAGQRSASTGVVNVFDKSKRTVGSFVDYLTGNLVAKSASMSTDFIPANAGGQMILNSQISEVVYSAGDPSQSSTVNLFPLNGMETNVMYVTSDGSQRAVAGYYETPYIIVTGLAKVTINTGFQGLQYGPIFFDSNKQFLVGDGTYTTCGPVGPVGGSCRSLIEITIPAGAYYMRYGMNTFGGTMVPGYTVRMCCAGDMSQFPIGNVAFVPASPVFVNGIAKYDRTKTYLRGTISPIAAATPITMESDVAFVRIGFAADIGSTLMVVNGATLPSNYKSFGTYAPNEIDDKIAAGGGGGGGGPVSLASQWPAMAGLLYWLTLTDNESVSCADASGNNNRGTITGDTTTAAQWLGSVGVKLGTQQISVPNVNGRPTNGFCAYFPVGGANPSLRGDAAGGQSSFVLGQSYGTPYGHGAMAFFPLFGRSNGSPTTVARDGVSGIHCIEMVAGDGANIKDIIVIDGKECEYNVQTSGGNFSLGAGQLTNAVYSTGGTIYSMWASANRDTVQQAIARTKSEMQRLSSLGVQFGYPKPNWKTDSVLCITGTSIDQGFQATHPPAFYLTLDFPATVYNLSISGQAPKDMDAGYEDREAKVYNARGSRNIAWHGGVTNGLINYLQDPQDALLDVIAWGRRAKAHGYKTVVSTMISRNQAGFNGLSSDVLAQQFNASLLAMGDEFDWVANLAADPNLGATAAATNLVYFADGVHPNSTGQALWVAIFNAGINGVYGNPLTPISANYTQKDSDRVIVFNGSTASSLTLKNANRMSFNRAGVLQVLNNGSAALTLTPVASQTIGGQASFTLAAGQRVSIRAFVANASVGGANWLLV